jgi:exonuclease V gamma subunit
MAKKSATSRKPAEEPVSDEAQNEQAPIVEAVPARLPAKLADDQAANNNVAISDIKKAVTFANSVGGLEKAIALLQIVKVAKDVQ